MNYFSVIVPIYYGEKYIPIIIRQIESCKEQMNDESNFELLFVNDAPNKPIALKWKSKVVEVRIINSNKNVGIHGARMKGLMQCKGNYILFLDQDDKIKPNYFESQLHYLGGGDAVICKAIHEKKHKYGLYLPFEFAVSKDYMLSQGNGIVSPGQVLLRKETISAIWKNHILIHNGADDWFLWLCMMNEGKNFVLNNEILFEHVVGEANSSENLLEMTCSENEMIEILENEKIFSEVELSRLKNTVSGLCQNRIKRVNKLAKMYFIYEMWLKLIHDQHSIATGMRIQKYNAIAIYGAGYFGKQLYKELKKNCIDVIYFIDRNAEHIKDLEIPIYKPGNNLPDVDLIIVTLIQDGIEVAKQLQENSFAKIVCLEELFTEYKDN